MATATPETIEFVAHLNDKLGETTAYGTVRSFDVQPALKFDKIVNVEDGRVQSVHAFVERATGKLIKAATFKAPQKDKDGLAYRFDLSTPEGMQEAKDAATRHGGYLYKR